jgi:hypothetical protein
MAPPYLPGEKATPAVVNGKVLSAAAEQAESPDSYLWSVRNQELGDWYLNVSLFLPFQQLNSLILMDI